MPPLNRAQLSRERSIKILVISSWTDKIQSREVANGANAYLSLQDKRTEELSAVFAKTLQKCDKGYIYYNVTFFSFKALFFGALFSIQRSSHEMIPEMSYMQSERAKQGYPRYGLKPLSSVV
jgi:hypothetical protein